MSIFTLGINDVSEGMQAMKDKLASKDAQIAAQQGELMRRAGEMEEMKQSLTDALQKLNNETSLVLQLENTLAKVNTDLQSSNINIQNTSTALASTEEKLRQKDLEAKELENTLVSLSRDLEGHQTRIGKIEAEKKKFEGRVKELESTVRATVVSPAAPSSRPRSRSSSISDLRITTLENELAELRRTLVSRNTEIQTIQSKLELARRDAIRANNDQMASEARLNIRVAELESLLADREEELQCLQEQGGPGGYEREEELLKRIDEDEAKIQALERLVGDANDLPVMKQKLKTCEEMLKSKLLHVDELESRNVELVQEKEEALDELIEARDIISGLETHNGTLSSDLQKLKSRSTPSSIPDKESLDNVERLLGAVDRLRGERDDLRRDIQFLDMESKFTISALEAKVASLSATPVFNTSPDLHRHDDLPLIRVTPCANEQSNAAWVTTERKEVERLQKLALGCGLVIGNLEAERTVTQAQADSFHNACAEKASSLALVEERLRETESRLTSTIQLLEETTAQRNDTMSRLSALDAEWRLKNDNVNLEQHESRLAVDHLNAQLVDISKILASVTSERDSLNVQVTNLNSDIASARQELTEAESRYTQLQFHQLSDMPSTQATKALRSQIEELEGRILRRTEQIGIQQHDIRRLETNLRLQEDRLTEMTTEMEMIVAQKDAMVEDCADARDQRDEAIMNVERLEEKVERLESLLEDRNREQEAIIEVMFLNSARTKEKMNMETGQIEEMRARMKSLLEEHDNTLHNVENLNEALEDARERLRSSEQDAKRVTESLASSREELARSVLSTHDLEQVKIDLAGRVQQLEDQLQSRVAEVATLASQLDSVQQKTAATLKQRTETIEGLESELEVTRSSLSSKESEYRVALEALQQQISQKDQLLANSDLEGELVQLKMKHIEDLGQLQSRLVRATSDLDELQARHDSAQVEHEQRLADSAQSRARVEQQLEETARELVLLKEMKESLEAASRQHADEIQQLEERLASSDSGLTSAREKLDDIDSCLLKKDDELAKTREKYEELLTEARNALSKTQTQLDKESLAARDSRQEASALQQKLKQEVEGRSQDQLRNDEALRDAKESQEQAEMRVKELSRRILMLETQIQDATAQIESLQVDKQDAQKNMTALEADIQRSLSMNRHLESQIRESERTIANLRDELDHVNTHVAKVEKACNTAEVSLSLQNAQHKRELSQLHQEIETLKSRPDLEGVVAELEERINEMEDLLRKKCEEIEENDDVKLGLLKENKSLKTKVESLTRKVNNLQTKLVAAKATLPAPTTVEQRMPSSASTIPVSSSSSLSSASTSPVAIPASTSRPRTTTIIGTPNSSIPSDKVSPPTISGTMNRVVSVPSALPRPKTPERRTVLGPVFRAMSPKKDKPKPEPSSAQSKKRRAPDDYEGYEIPPQAFTAESLPRDGENISEHTTPKVRRVLSSIQTGFTPTRHQNRPTIPMPSPKRSNPVFIKTSPSLPEFPSSRTPLSSVGQPVDGKKRSWLGKIRGASSVAPQRDFS